MSLIAIDEVTSMTVINIDKLNQINELHKSGVSIRQIAKIVNSSKSTVQRYLAMIKEHHAPLKTDELNDLQKRICNLKSEGFTKNQIIEKFNPKLKTLITKKVKDLEQKGYL